MSFVPTLIHKDDSIMTIKKKLIYAYDKLVAFEKIYLFMETETQLNPVKVYDKITQNEKVEITEKS